jgi:hypothetical protein
MLSFNISYWDLIKFPCFGISLKEGIGGEREGDFTNNFNDFSEYYLIFKNIHLIHNENEYVGLV